MRIRIGYNKLATPTLMAELRGKQVETDLYSLLAKKSPTQILTLLF